MQIFLCCVAGYLWLFAIGAPTSAQDMKRNVHGTPEVADNENKSVEAATIIQNAIRIFLCGDVMTGRGIDQILPYPGDPTIYESYMTSAQGYVKIAEEVNGPIDYPVSFLYVWGDILRRWTEYYPMLG